VVRDLEPTIGLIFGLSGRLSRCERCLQEVIKSSQTVEEQTGSDTTQEQSLLIQKRRNLERQLEEAQNIKTRVELRRNALAERLNEILTPDDYDAFETFTRCKVRLYTQFQEICDKIKLGEEQAKLLRLSLGDQYDESID
jgi:dsDNA-specific endonuclease/ATPase MutS2